MEKLQSIKVEGGIPVVHVFGQLTGFGECVLIINSASLVKFTAQGQCQCQCQCGVSQSAVALHCSPHLLLTFNAPFNPFSVSLFLPPNYQYKTTKDCNCDSSIFCMAPPCFWLIKSSSNHGFSLALHGSFQCAGLINSRAPDSREFKEKVLKYKIYF